MSNRNCLLDPRRRKMWVSDGVVGVDRDFEGAYEDY